MVHVSGIDFFMVDFSEIFPYLILSFSDPTPVIVLNCFDLRFPYIQCPTVPQRNLKCECDFVPYSNLLLYCVLRFNYYMCKMVYKFVSRAHSKLEKSYTFLPVFICDLKLFGNVLDIPQCLVMADVRSLKTGSSLVVTV